MATKKIQTFDPAKAVNTDANGIPKNYTGWTINDAPDGTYARYATNGKWVSADTWDDMPPGNAYQLNGNKWTAVGKITANTSIVGQQTKPLPDIQDNRPAPVATGTPAATTAASAAPSAKAANKPLVAPPAAPTDKANASTPPTATTTPATTAVGGALPADINGTNVPQVEAQLNKEYPAIYSFWMSDPTLKSIFESSVADGTIASLQKGSAAAAQKFGQALQPWIAKNGSSMLAAEADKAALPGKYQETLTNRQSFVKDTATQLGYSNLDDATLNKVAELTFNTDYLDSSFGTQAGQDRLKTYLAQTAAASKMALTGGTAAQTRTDLINYNNQMGNPYSSAWIDSAVSDIADPSKGVSPDTYKTMIKTASASKYSGFADQINKGVSVQQIADPYISKMTDLLELPYNTSNYSQYLNDPLIQKAMSTSIGKDGTTQPMTNYDFANTVRQDPRWAYTNNARDSVNGMLHQIGKDFGFTS
jgi:hypothetical protein